MKELSIVSSKFTAPQELQEYIKYGLDFPDYYGGNFSALYDCLCESTQQLCLEFEMDSFCNEQIKAYIKKLLSVCKNAAQENELLKLSVIFSEEEW